MRIATVGSKIRLAKPLGRQRDAHQRRPQVLLDVEGQRPQRRDVQHPGAGLRLARAAGDVHQPVDRGQEGGEGLAAARGRADERVLAPRMAGQPCTWGGVGSGNDAANQARTAGENAASTG